ncbi:MAG: translation initiation factor 2 [Eubacterium sp.]|nr:translation initiation factor 2 [Eubacterium sp.]
MKGKHHIVIETSRLKYEFDVRRNITIIQGDSATGKTTLIDLLQQYADNRMDSGILLQSDVPCIVFGGSQANWQIVLQSIENSIIFFDENHLFTQSQAFAETVRGSSNYYVLITRRALPELPYSVNEIYGIRTSGKYHFPHKIYHEFYPIYQSNEQFDSGDVVLAVEDSGAGFQFFSAAADKTKCISAGGNANLYQLALQLYKTSRVVVIADGAAFGAFVEKIVSLARVSKKIMLYMPESFEWLILKSGAVEIAGISDILNEPEKYIESASYFSWERFFSDLLERETAADPIRHYQKNDLAPYYLGIRNKEKILRTLPGALRAAITGDRV